MAHRDQWKMLHLLNTCSTESLNRSELADMGINCFNDTIQELVNDGLVGYTTGGEYKLTQTTQKMLNKFLVAKGTTGMKEVYVDFPSCFVVMPFSQPWSDDVYEKLIKAALLEATMQCVRGDIIPRVGKLAENVVVQIQKAGLIIAEISEPNPNVYYELGIADTLGKDVFVLYDKHVSVPLPADIQGMHYYPYDRNNLEEAKEFLKDELVKWKAENRVDNVPNHCRI